jgi:hypothetical protein
MAKKSGLGKDLGKAIAAALIALVGYLIDKYGKKIIVWVSEKIARKYRKYFRSKNILILGAARSGKTSLINFLATGRPYQLREDVKESPNPTSGAVVVGKRAEVAEGQHVTVSKDVGGEFRHLWGELIRELQPEGIIYMIDGRLQEAGLREALTELDNDVLSHFKDDRHSLIALHVFLNFVDKWGKKPAEIRQHTRLVSDALDAVIDKRPALERIRRDVSETQLNPDADAWPETNRAIHRFGALLMEK